MAMTRSAGTCSTRLPATTLRTNTAGTRNATRVRPRISPDIGASRKIRVDELVAGAGGGRCERSEGTLSAEGSTALVLKTIEALGVARFLRLTELPAAGERVREERAGPDRRFHLGEIFVEALLEEVLQQARGDCVPQVLVLRAPPAEDELPDLPGIRLDVDLQPDDRLPPRIDLAGGRGDAGQKALGLLDGFPDRHRARQSTMGS